MMMMMMMIDHSCLLTRRDLLTLLVFTHLNTLCASHSRRAAADRALLPPSRRLCFRRRSFVRSFVSRITENYSTDF